MLAARPRSLVWATEIDVLPLDRIVTRRESYWTIRSPSNPAHYWGNLLLFDRTPAPGAAQAWETAFAREFGDEPRVRHQTFAWDCADGDAGSAHSEFVTRGYDLDDLIGLVAGAGELLAHPRANRDVEVRALDPAAGRDEALWTAVAELQVANRDDGHAEAAYRSFVRARLHDRRELLRAGRGSWYAAVEPPHGRVVGSCGVVVTGGRGRFQAVDTALSHRRRGIGTRLVVDAAQHAAVAFGADRFVIVADARYHALGLYESLGFRRREHVHGVCRWPRGA